MRIDINDPPDFENNSFKREIIGENASSLKQGNK